MTQRMKKFGITEESYNQGVKRNEFLNNADAFFAKLLTLERGTQIRGIDLMRKWFPEYSDCEYFLQLKLEQAQPFLFGLTAIHNECLNYTNTFGLDCLNIK